MAGGRFPLLSCPRHDNLVSLFLEILVWVIAIALQAGTVALWTLAAIVNIGFLSLWLVFGTFTHLTKTIAIGHVWNVWFAVWTQSDRYNTSVLVDTDSLNECLQHEFYYETIPQFILQLTNNIMLNSTFSPLAYFSMLQSIIMAVNGIWRFVYFRYLLDEPLELKDIPLNCSFEIIIERLGIDFKLNGKLEPCKKETFVVQAVETTELDNHIELGNVSPTNSRHIDLSVLSGSSSNEETTLVYCTLPVEEKEDEEGASTVSHPHVSSDHESSALSPSQKFSEWLTDELTKVDVSADQIENVVEILLRDNINSKKVLSMMDETRFGAAYLDSIGIHSMGLQQHIMLLCAELKRAL